MRVQAWRESKAPIINIQYKKSYLFDPLNVTKELQTKQNHLLQRKKGSFLWLL